MSPIHRTEAIEAVGVQQLRYAAAALAYLLAVLYLFHPTLGTTGLVAYVASGRPLLDPRPAALVASAVLLVVGVKLALLGVPRSPLYVAGALVLVGHLVGYVLWHATGHGGFLPWIDPHGHDVGLLELTLGHLLNDRWALVTKSVEVALLGLLIALVVYDAEASNVGR